MPIIEHNGIKVNLDDKGFLLNFEDWEKDSRYIGGKGRNWSIDRRRIDILKFMREYYKKYNFFPIVRQVCKNVHQAKNCVNEKS